MVHDPNGIIDLPRLMSLLAVRRQITHHLGFRVITMEYLMLHETSSAYQFLGHGLSDHVIKSGQYSTIRSAPVWNTRQRLEIFFRLVVSSSVMPR